MSQARSEENTADTTTALPPAHLKHEEEDLHDETNFAATQEEELKQEAKAANKKAPAILQQLQKFTSFLWGLLIAITAAILFGLHPTFTRYFQSLSESKMPTLLLMASCQVTVTLLYLPRILYKLGKKALSHKEDFRQYFKTLTPRIAWNTFTREILFNWKAVIFCISVTLRSVTNYASTAYTLAIYVQLIGLLLPFLLSFLTIFLYYSRRAFVQVKTRVLKVEHEYDMEDEILEKMMKEEKITWRLAIAMIITLAGSILTILGGLSPSSPDAPWYQFLYEYRVDITLLVSKAEAGTLFGLFLSLISNVMLACYMTSVKLIQAKPSAKFATQSKPIVNQLLSDPEILFHIQASVLTFTFPLSLAIDDWSIWLRLGLKDWLMFACFVMLVTFAANIVQVYALQANGALVMGQMLSIRMLATLLFSGLILGEFIKTVWQIVGSLIVLAGISMFMIIRYKENKKRQQQEAEFKKQQETTQQEAELEPVHRLVDEDQQIEDNEDELMLEEGVKQQNATEDNKSLGQVHH